MHIYLDDLRTPRTVKDWVICRNLSEFKRAIRVWYEVNEITNEGDELYISFDHDLGPDETGYDAIKWFTEYLLKDDRYGPAWYIPEMIDINVHSANPIGAKTIIRYWESFKDHLENE